MKYFYLIICFSFLGCGNQKCVKEKPLIVFLHGYGDNEDHFLKYSNEFKNDFDTQLMRGYFDLKNQTFSWGSIHYNEEKNTWFDKKDALYSIVKLRDALKVEDREIILVGMSQGATISYALGINYPDKFKTVVAINGYVDENLLLNRYHLTYDDSNFLRLNGSNDYIINQKMVETSSSILDSLKIENKLITHSEDHSYSEEQLNDIKNWIYKLNKLNNEKN